MTPWIAVACLALVAAVFAWLFFKERKLNLKLALRDSIKDLVRDQTTAAKAAVAEAKEQAAIDVEKARQEAQEVQDGRTVSDRLRDRGAGRD